MLKTCLKTSQTHQRVADNLYKNSSRKKQLPKRADIDMLTTVFHSFWNGISIQARDGTSFDSINAAITQIMSIWDELAKECK